MSTTCRHCSRTIVQSDSEGWIDPEAPATPEYGDDHVWRVTCDQSPHFAANHEPASDVVGYVVQDSTDGYVWGRDERGEPFTREDAEAFAAGRNSHMPSIAPYRVLALVEV